MNSHELSRATTPSNEIINIKDKCNLKVELLKDIGLGSRKLTMERVRRPLLFVPCSLEAEPAFIEIEKYDTVTSRKAISNERFKFYSTMRTGGDYEAAYDINRTSLPDNLGLQLLPMDARKAEARKYEEEYITWITKYDLRHRDTGEKVTLEELNADIDEWMSNRPIDNGDDVWVDLEERFRSLAVFKRYTQGPDARETLFKQKLDEDLDSYMAHGIKKEPIKDPSLIDPEDRFAEEDFPNV